MLVLDGQGGNPIRAGLSLKKFLSFGSSQELFYYLKQLKMNEQNMEAYPNYYAIIPANVRYDEDLKANEKLLYGEITALSQRDGKCWATNSYFAKLYGVSIVSISNWIKNLREKGYIETKIIYKDGTKEILYRYIRILEGGIKENFKTPIKENLYRYIRILEGGIKENFKTPIKENFKDNNTSINNTRIIKKNNISKDILQKKEKFGEFGNVKLTKKEYENLKIRFLENDLKDLITKLDLYLGQKGDKYKSHYMTLINWGKREGIREFTKQEREKIKEREKRLEELKKNGLDFEFIEQEEISKEKRKENLKKIQEMKKKYFGN